MLFFLRYQHDYVLHGTTMEATIEAETAEDAIWRLLQRGAVVHSADVYSNAATYEMGELPVARYRSNYRIVLEGELDDWIGRWRAPYSLCYGRFSPGKATFEFCSRVYEVRDPENGKILTN